MDLIDSDTQDLSIMDDASMFTPDSMDLNNSDTQDQSIVDDVSMYDDNEIINSPDQVFSQEALENDQPYYIEPGLERAYAGGMARDIPYRIRFNNIWRGRRIGNWLDDLVDMFNDVLHQFGAG